MMFNFKSFDGTTNVNCDLYNYDQNNCREIELNFHESISPRGAGLSPRLLSAKNNGESVILSNKYNGKDFILDLNLLTVEVNSNATFAEVNKFAFNFGLELPVVGYSSIQIGSGIASCIHGKNHFLYDFGHHVESFELLLFNKEIVTCSRFENPIIFNLTIGGYGSTGLILSAVLNLKKIISTTIKRERVSISNFNDLYNYYDDSTLKLLNGSFGWHNLHKNQTKFGRGFIYQDKYENNDLYMPPKYPKKPAHLYSPSSLYIPGKYIFGNLFNYMYEIKESRNKKTSFFNNYAEAISSKNIYWSIMRANSFIETQYIIPYDKFNEYSIYLQDVLKKTNATISVCITKPANGTLKYLRFRNKGINLDITGVKSIKNLKFFSELNSTINLFNGIPNIIKCSILDIKSIQQSYGVEFNQFYIDYKKVFGRTPPEWFLQNGLLKF